jgi:hypothetical protein
MNIFMILGISLFALMGIVVLVFSCLPSPMVNKLMRRFKTTR